MRKKLVTLTRIAVAATACLALTAAGSPSGKINQAFIRSQAALVLRAGANVLVKVAYDTDPLLGAVVQLGVYGFEQAGKRIRLLASDPVVTVLAVRQVINGQPRYSLFKVTTSRQLTVRLNGQFVEYISAHKIVIDADPGKPSTIVVTVKNQAGTVYRKGSFNFNWYPVRQLLANFDTGQNRHLSDRSAEIRLFAGPWGIGSRLNGVNGTEFYKWPGSRVPMLLDCASVPARDWGAQVVGLFHLPEAGTTWCLRTSQHRYGILVANTNIEYQFLYLLWKRQRVT